MIKKKILRKIKNFAEKALSGERDLNDPPIFSIFGRNSNKHQLHLWNKK